MPIAYFCNTEVRIARISRKNNILIFLPNDDDIMTTHSRFSLPLFFHIYTHTHSFNWTHLWNTQWKSPDYYLFHCYCLFIKEREKDM